MRERPARPGKRTTFWVGRLGYASLGSSVPSGLPALSGDMFWFECLAGEPASILEGVGRGPPILIPRPTATASGVPSRAAILRKRNVVTPTQTLHTFFRRTTRS